jgi:hypothetical protein
MVTIALVFFTILIDGMNGQITCLLSRRSEEYEDSKTLSPPSPSPVHEGSRLYEGQPMYKKQLDKEQKTFAATLDTYLSLRAWPQARHGRVLDAVVLPASGRRAFPSS